MLSQSLCPQFPVISRISIDEPLCVSMLSVTPMGVDETKDDFDGTLVVSYTNQFELQWSTHGVIESSGYQCSIWRPKLGQNEYFLGHLLSAEKTYPKRSFLVIIKRNGSDSDAFRRPTGLTLIWSTRFNDPAAPKQAHFYKPVAPKGYVAMGDVVIRKAKGAACTVEV